MAKTEASAEEATAKGGGRRRLVLLVALALLATLAAAYVLVLKPDAAGAAEKPEPGEVLALESITLNLADGHYLKLGLALQMTADAGEGGHGGVDGSQALDIAIEQLSGRPVEELAAGQARAKAKEELFHAIEEAYHHTVLDVYFTEFVMQ